MPGYDLLLNAGFQHSESTWPEPPYRSNVSDPVKR